MSDTIYLKAFPVDKFEALAMLYLQQQDLSGLSPEEVFDKYQDAYNRMKRRHEEGNPPKTQQIRC